MIYWTIIFNIVSIKFHYICLEYALNRWMEEGYTKTVAKFGLQNHEICVATFFCTKPSWSFYQFLQFTTILWQMLLFCYNLNILDTGIWFLRLFDNAYILFPKNFIIQLYFTNSTSTTFFVCAKNRAANAFDSLG